MSNEKQTEEKNDKVMTKYERKLEKRKADAEEEKKSWQRFKVGSIIVAAVLVVAILGSIAMNAYDNYAALHKAYITVGDHEVTEVEFDYYFYNSVNSYLDTYGEYVAMFGLDTTTPLDQQMYSEELTWADYFDESAVISLKRVKALADDAQANGFTYDDSEDIANIESEIAAGAEEEGVTVSSYYMMSYGENASAERIRPILKENVLATAYHTYLVQENQPTEEEIQTKYEENKMAYDLIDCRKYYFAADVTAESTDEEIEEAMAVVKEQADEFLSRREAGEEFEALCAEYAPEDQKENYGGETDGSLIEGGTFYEVPSLALNWLYDETRAEGDVSVFEDTTNHRYYVVEYLDRSNDWETTSASIANSLAETKASEYENALIAQYEEKEARGKLAYLSIPLDEEETETAAEAEESTEAAE